MEPTSKKPIITVFTIFLVILAAWLTYSIIGVTKAIETKKWPTVKATVLSSEVIRVSSKGSSQFKPVIRYSFKIDTAEYTSDQYSSTSARGSSEWAKELIGQYPDNKGITVHYNPADPKESVIETGLQSDNYWMTILSAFFFIVVSLAFIKQLKTKQ